MIRGRVNHRLRMQRGFEGHRIPCSALSLLFLVLFIPLLSTLSVSVLLLGVYLLGVERCFPER